MKEYIVHHEWKVIEDGFHPDYNRVSESLFSLGNGHTGQRANFEEKYSGDSLPGNYVAGVYYPDKTLVGWWKNGYPEYFAKILNAANWIGIRVEIEGEELDLATARVHAFRRELDMKDALLTRSFTAELPSGKQVEVLARRFLSMKDKALGAIRYNIKSLNFSAPVKITSFIDGDVKNEDSNYDEKFWMELEKKASDQEAYLLMETKKSGFHVCHGIGTRLLKNGKNLSAAGPKVDREKYLANTFVVNLQEGEELLIEKFAAINSSLYISRNELMSETEKSVQKAMAAGFDQLFAEHSKCWEEKWEAADIRIEGDVAAQQGIRFNIFQLMQTYTGDDERLNIGPKGFTGEKYGGVTYWDTEAYCLPFFLGTAPQRVAQNLLIYRHKHLQKAIENAQKLGFENGAALYPMVTINGEECHNEWEITFEEIHRNGAIAYAIYNYINYTGDREYLAPYGFEVLLALSRFWAQRVNWSDVKQAYVILGVTGPNEYENNVNNNFHTNNMAVWTLKYTLEVIDYLKKEQPYLWEELVNKWKFNEVQETTNWKEIIENMYFPYDKELDIYLQQDGFLDKEIIPAAHLNPTERPINQHWSWDRILRSCYIKQADTLQSLYWFQEDYDTETLRRHFDFYEPITVHESSLSSCIHAILAARIGREEKAYEMYLRTARLDLDDYNNDTEDGLHITSMGGTWMAFVEAFGGIRVVNGQLHLNPFLPKSWKGYAFRLNFRDSHLEISMANELTIINHHPGTLTLSIWGEEHILNGNHKLEVEIKQTL
ncbi:family 65 glycosyl hydrolase domain-containing protein [Gaoshiqia sediminis]|uniref:Family 65 glycosyl hydrolase domain-containing protein n=1 Tax=Gaoshiqia sediminis TaxID=2986998 RepID=A0AA42C8R0_9BACT|nr:family 65 glycosyl hydrolase domain-containing protein [Gaoshiqia sediminis]MCW0481517.1 family 65 glycosyl hydrolase domain-containing protein [Gaoshiqia sediminis]